MAAGPKNNKAPNYTEYSNCKTKYETNDFTCKISIAAIFNFIPTSNFISIHSPSIYKLSKIRCVHELCFRVIFQVTYALYALFTLYLKKSTST